MNIAFVTQEYPPETAHGGIGTQACAKAHALAARGHKVWVVSHSVDDQRHESWQGRVRLIRIPAIDSRLNVATDEAQWLTYSAMVAIELDQLRRDASLDLIEFADWACESYIHLLNRVSWNHVPVVIHLHGPVVMFGHALGWPDPASRFFQVARDMECTCLTLADAIFSSSECSARWVAQHYGLNPAQIPILHTGIDTRQFRPLPVPKEVRPTVLFVGKIERTKGVDVLVDAGIQLASEIPDLKLRLIGRGNVELGMALQQRAAAAGFPELVELVGFVPRERLPEEFSRAHLFAGPSLYEGGPGFVYLEAMACGLPVIACSGSGASEAVQDGVTGQLVETGSRDALADAMRNLLLNEPRRLAMGEHARQFASQNADSEKCLEQLANFYESIVRQAKGPVVEC